jgi:hypothetical protein
MCLRPNWDNRDDDDVGDTDSDGDERPQTDETNDGCGGFGVWFAMKANAQITTTRCRIATTEQQFFPLLLVVVVVVVVVVMVVQDFRLRHRRLSSQSVTIC